MHSTEKLASAFRRLLTLVEEEARQNPSFAARLEEISSLLPAASPKKTPRRKRAGPTETAPNVFAMRQQKGEQEFPFWVRSLDLRVLKAIVKANGFDPGKVSQRWTEPDKFVQLIVEQVAARLRRGTAFLTAKTPQVDDAGDP